MLGGSWTYESEAREEVLSSGLRVISTLDVIEMMGEDGSEKNGPRQEKGSSMTPRTV